MNCRRAEDMFIEYLYGELEPDRAEPLRAHLDECLACRTRLAELARVRQLVTQVPDLEPSPMAINRVIARAREEEERSRSILGFRWVKVLAPLCLAVVIGGLVAYQFRAGLAPKPMVYAPAKEEQSPVVQEPGPAPEPGKKSSPPALGGARKLTAPASPKPASPRVALPPPPAAEPGASHVASPQPATDSTASRPGGPEAFTSARGEAPSTARLSAQQGGAERPPVGASRASVPAAAPPQAGEAVRGKAVTPAAGGKPEASVPSLLREGERSLEAGRYGEASQAFSQALKLLRPDDPDRPRALLGLARAQEGQKDLTTAIRTYRELAQESSAYRDLAERKIQELTAPEMK
jgi:hypothetical protein